jgi:hypothetical protein
VKETLNVPAAEYTCSGEESFELSVLASPKSQTKVDGNPSDVLVKYIVSFIHTAADTKSAVGTGFTTTVLLVVSEHPLPPKDIRVTAKEPAEV